MNAVDAALNAGAQTLRLELEVAREERELFRALLQADEAALADFFAHAAVSIEQMRTTLRLSTRENAAFRGKISRLLEEIGRIDTAARALPLPTVLQRLRSCTQALSELQARSELSGNDLLPSMVLIENLCNHIAIGADAAGMASSLDPSGEQPLLEQTPPLEQTPAMAPHSAQMAAALRQLSAQMAEQHDRNAALTLIGIESIPEDWTHTLFDVLSQLVRNAVEHGIEPAADRNAAGKPPAGMLTAEFCEDDGGYMLSFQDDGAGLDVQGIAAAAVSRGLLPQAATAALDMRHLASLIFHDGLTTAGDGRRGAGMSIVREQVRKLGGQVQIASKRGRFTRYRIRLPPAEAATGASGATGAASTTSASGDAGEEAPVPSRASRRSRR